MRIPDRLVKVRLAIDHLEEAEKLMTAAHISTQSIDDNIIYLRNKEKEFENMMKADQYQCPLGKCTSDKELLKER